MMDIKGYEGLYAITSCGKVWSYKYKKFLKPGDKNGYKRVCLCKNGVKRNFRVHRLVAQAYIPNPDNYDTVDHIDKNRENNCINNLRWMSASENAARAHRKGGDD